MTMHEQEHIKQTEYAAAMRYMANAKDMLKKAGREGKRFKDSKYVSSASGIAYKGALVALDAWLRLKGVKLPEKREAKNGKSEESKSIGFYRKVLTNMDRKLLDDLNGVYKHLHLDGYYDGTLLVGIIDTGFSVATDIIDRIKPREATP
jgi:hypothetical protein